MAVAVHAGMIARLFVGLACVAASFAAVGCGSSRLDAGTGTGGTTGLGGSPGTVTFILTTSSSYSYCDQLSCADGPVHLSITSADGQPVDQYGYPCGTVDCATCTGYACPEVAAIACPASQGFAYTGGTSTWDGSYSATSTCGASHTTCGLTKYMPPGQYVAQFCATQGSVTHPDAGLPVCTATAPQECTQALFEFPSATPVQLSLPHPIGLL